MTVFSKLYVHIPTYITVANTYIQTMLDQMDEELVNIETDNYTPDNFKISKLYPNPFNPKLNINVELGSYENLEVYIIDINGNRIMNLYSGFLDPGNYNFKWNADDIASGVYFIKAISKRSRIVKKVVLLK